jgi:triosephosphate isomerase
MTWPTPVIAGNWKMFKGPRDTRAFMAAFLEASPARSDRTTIVFPPTVSLAAASAARDGRTDVQLGVQDVHWEDQGAFTGDVSAPMAAEAGATFALAGHSERRHGLGETSETVARKASAALRSGLVPIICVGETLQEREDGRLATVLDTQLAPVLDQFDDDALAAVLFAYEPVWAIGTGRTATPADATLAHAHLRRRLEERLGARAREIPILYGGSVKPANVRDLLATEHVDGVLVGGASLDPDSFAALVAG